MTRVFLSVLTIIFLAASPVYASSCYSQQEAEAEQGIRIHSELMVIGLNCQHMGVRKGDNLYLKYRQFTADHAELFAKYEQILLSHFLNLVTKKPEEKLNALRTNFANKISNDAAAMRPDVFCSRYAPRITKASEMKHNDLRKWASTFYESHPVSKPFCASGG